jgi:hypothetical protein
MLLKHLFSLCALALGSLSAPSAPLNDTLAHTRPTGHHAVPVTRRDYSGQEVEQIRQAHLDAVKLCWTTVNHAKSAQFDRIFPEYFNPKDRNLVICK